MLNRCIWFEQSFPLGLLSNVGSVAMGFQNVEFLQDKRLVRRWGYSFKGTRACIKRYMVWAPRVSAIAVMGASDVRCVSTVRGSVNGDRFVQFMREEVVPLLEPFDGINHNSILVMGMYDKKSNNIKLPFMQ